MNQFNTGGGLYCRLTACLCLIENPTATDTKMITMTIKSPTMIVDTMAAKIVCSYRADCSRVDICVGGSVLLLCYYIVKSYQAHSKFFNIAQHV